MTTGNNTVRLSLVEAFVVVADELHFGRASERLGVAQSSTSEQVRQLEDDLNVVLFDRSTRTVRLSREGEALLPSAKLLVAQVAQFNNRASAVRDGVLTVPLRLGYVPATAGTMMPIVISTLKAIDPVLLVETFGMNVTEVRAALRAKEIDVGLLFSVETLEPSINWMTLIDERAIVAMGPSHPLAGETILTLDQIADVGVAIAPYLTGQTLVDVEAQFLRLGRTLRITRREPSIEDLLLHLLSGTNISLGSEWMRPGLEAFGCVTVPIAERIPVRWGLAALPGLSPHIRTILERVAELIANTPPEQLSGSRYNDNRATANQG